MSDLKYRKPDAEPSAVKAEADNLWDVFDQLLGGSGDSKEKLSSAAIEFTDLLAEQIIQVSADGEAAWRKAALASSYAADVTMEWATDLEWYETRISILKIELAAKKAALLGLSAFFSGVGADEEDLERYKKVVNEANSEAHKLWKELEGRADDCSAMMSEGPTDANVKKLMKSGRLGWIPNNIAGSEMPTPVTPSEGEEMGKKLQRHLDGSEELSEEEYAEIIATLNAVNERAVHAKRNGQKLEDREISFLDRFYEGLEDLESPNAYGDGYPRGVLGIPDHLDKSDLSENEKEELSRELGGGLLVLSNTEYGGGYDRLPESVQRVAEGSSGYDVTASREERQQGLDDSSVQSSAWYQEASGLASLFEKAPIGVSGGTGFSAALTTTVGTELDEDSERKISVLGSPNAKGTFQEIIQKSTLNEEANYLVLSGEYETSRLEVDREKTLTGLYTYDWEDDGESVSGLTSWIPDAANSDDPLEREKAGTAAVGLIEGTSRDDEVFQDLTDTGVDLTEEKKSRDASFTEVNPLIARDFEEIFETYLPDFGLEIDDGKTFAYEEDQLRVDSRARVRFLQYIAGDDEAARDAIIATEKYQLESMSEFMSTGDPEVAANSGRVKGLLGAGITNETLERVSGDDAAIEREQKLWKAGIDGFIGEITGKMPGTAIPGENAKQYVQAEFDKYREELMNSIPLRTDQLEGEL